jgi:hypothetical protein
VEAKPLLDGLLCDGDQLANIFCRCFAQVDHDVGMDVGDLGVAMPKTLQAALIDQSSRADSFDFLEDRSRTWVKLKPRMPASSPTEVFLHDSMHYRCVAGHELERGGQYYIPAAMENAGIVSKLHVVPAYDTPVSFFGQNLR